jgi:hypothetical protein
MARATAYANAQAELDEQEDDDIHILTQGEINQVWGTSDSKKEGEPALEPVSESATQDEFQTFEPARLKRKRLRYFEKLDPRFQTPEPEPKKLQNAPPQQSAMLPRANKIYYASRT